MKLPVSAISLLFIFTAYSFGQQQQVITIAEIGKSPFVHIDEKGIAHLVFCQDRNLVYTHSDNQGLGFSNPVIVDQAEIRKFSSPHIASTKDYIIIAAANNKNIYTWRRKKNETEWEKPVKVNEVDGVATEEMVSIAGGKDNLVYAAWVDERQKGSFKLYGSYSIDGGMTWAKSNLLYKSPDGSICPCCKPDVAIYKDSVYVMFRNDVNGNRNMYLMLSENEGVNFNGPKKLGLGTWQLNGCPVDGGGIAIDRKGKVYTAWRRSDELFIAEPDKAEQKVGTGRMCKIANNGSGNYMIWQFNSEIIVRLTNGKTINLGGGYSPAIASGFNSSYVICTWVDMSNRILVKRFTE